MAKPTGPRKVYRYSEEFKATAVRLSNLAGVAVQDIASVLKVHPFVLSRWRRDAREGKALTKKVKLADPTITGLRELKKLKVTCARLQEENLALKKTLRAASAGKKATGKKPAAKKKASR